MSLPNNEDDDGNVAETSISSRADNSSILSRLSTRSSFIGPNKFSVTVQLLDRSDKHTFEYKKNATGQTVLDDVCKIANIAEKEYFGLQYEDNKFRYWVDLSKTLSKLFHRKAVVLRFRVRFYPTELSYVKEAVTRYHLFVQVHRDLLHGRLICSQNEGAQLAAFILQASIGDYNTETMGDDADYVSGYSLIMKQSHRIEEKISEIHKELKGLSTEEAETEFLEVASKLETYGFDPYVVKNMGQSQEVTIGTTSHGILLFVRGQKIHFLEWSYVQKVDYLGKQLTITPSKEYVTNFIQKQPSEIDAADDHNTSLNSSLFDSAETNGKSKSKKEQLKLICPSATFAKHLWRHILSQQVFFTEDQATNVKPKFSKPKIPLFSRGSTFRCPTPRVLHELEQDRSPPRSATENSFERYPLKKCQPRSVDEPWNASRSNSLRSTAKLSINEKSANANGNSDAVVLCSPSILSSTSSPVDDSSDGNTHSFLDKTPNGNSTLLSNAHSEELREAIANGSLNLFSNLSNSSLKNGLSNGNLYGQNGHLSHDTDSNKVAVTNDDDTATRALLFFGILFLLLASAFLIAYFFYPESLRGIQMHVPMLSQFELPPWLVPSALRK